MVFLKAKQQSIETIERGDSIYSIVPKEHISSVPNESKTKLLNFLRNNPDKSFTASKIAELNGLPTRGTQVEVRKILTELIELYFQPIISTSTGFCYTLNSKKLLAYAESLNHRVLGIQRRITAIKSIANQNKSL